MKNNTENVAVATTTENNENNVSENGLTFAALVATTAHLKDDVAPADADKRFLDGKVGGFVLTQGTRFFVVKNIERVVNRPDGSSLVLPYVVCVNANDTKSSFLLSARAFAASVNAIVKSNDGKETTSRVTPDALCPQAQRDQLAYKRMQGVEFTKVAEALHTAFGEMQIYECVASQTCNYRTRPDAAGETQELQKTIYSIIAVE